MVSGTRLDGGSQIIPARIRKTIQSIKEIVGNHSDADIYVMLKETNMDPNETAQKLLNQDPFHEVRRKRDKKKEDIGNNGYAEPVKHIEHVGRGIKSRTYVDRNARRGGYGRNALPDAGISREFRIVRDNRVNQNINGEAKPAPLQCSTSANEKPVSNVSERSSKVISTDQKHSGIRNSEGQKAYNNPINGPYDSGSRHSRDASIDGVHSNDVLEEAQTTVPYSVSRPRELKPNNSQHNSATLASSSSVVGVYSSSLDPVHVPSPDSRSSGPVGAIKREVGVVGVRRQQSSENSEHSSLPSNSFPNPLLRREISPSAESFPPSTSITKSDQLSQTTEPDSIMSSMSVSRSFLNTHYSSKPHQQLVGHQKAIQANMEWKPKSSQKSTSINPGGIGTATAPMSPVGNDSSDLKTEAADMPVKLSRVTIFENQHVIIPQHLRVPEADRARLIFGNFGAELDSSKNSAPGFQELESAEESNGEPSASVSASTSAISSEDVSGGNQELLDDQVRNSRSDSPSAVASELPLPDKRESLSPQNLENYADIGLVRNVSAAYTPVEQHQQQDPSGLPSFQAYDPQSGYDAPFFRPTVDENMRGQGLPSPQEALSSHTPNSIPASTMPIVQQPVAQLYPHVHLSHFPSFMPYRQFLSPVYVPPMAVPGYSSNPAYQHPSNSSSYLVMPGGSSHLTASGLKYGTQQYKPIPAANPTGFGNYTSQAGYALNSPGVVGGATGLEDSTRIKYKEGNLYIPNPQAETSEIWIQTPRELPGMQSAPYYNLPGQAPHAAYLPSHTAHASFNPAAAAQSPHMQFPGMYHPSPQPASIANPHHMVPGGVAAAAPGAQVGPYQQPQIGHLNWTTNF